MAKKKVKAIFWLSEMIRVVYPNCGECGSRLKETRTRYTCPRCGLRYKKDPAKVEAKLDERC